MTYFWLGKETEPPQSLGMTFGGGEDMRKFDEVLGEIMLAEYKRIFAEKNGISGMIPTAPTNHHRRLICHKRLKNYVKNGTVQWTMLR